MFAAFAKCVLDVKQRIIAPFTVEAAELPVSHACGVCKDTGKDTVHASLLPAEVGGVIKNEHNRPQDDEVQCLAYMHSGCPLNRRELGRAAWAYLHTLAAYYPDQPTEQEKKDMTSFMRMYARMYPCGYCADKTRDEMWRNPPRVDSQQELSLWVCEIHNEVNDRMGKPIFDCSKVAERWKLGSKECNQ